MIGLRRKARQSEARLVFDQSRGKWHDLVSMTIARDMLGCCEGRRCCSYQRSYGHMRVSDCSIDVCEHNIGQK